MKEEKKRGSAWAGASSSEEEKGKSPSNNSSNTIIPFLSNDINKGYDVNWSLRAFKDRGEDHIEVDDLAPTYPAKRPVKSGSLHILAGPPGSRKTSIAFHMACLAALKGRGACFFTWDWPVPYVFQLLSFFPFTPSQRDRILDSLFLYPFLDDFQEFQSVVNRLPERTFICCDYLQIMPFSTPYGTYQANETVRLDELIKTLRRISYRGKYDIFLLSAQNRESLKSGNGGLSSGRGTVQIEYGADSFAVVKLLDVNSKPEILFFKNRWRNPADYIDNEPFPIFYNFDFVPESDDTQAFPITSNVPESNDTQASPITSNAPESDDKRPSPITSNAPESVNKQLSLMLDVPESDKKHLSPTTSNAPKSGKRSGKSTEVADADDDDDDDLFVLVEMNQDDILPD